MKTLIKNLTVTILTFVLGIVSISVHRQLHPKFAVIDTYSGTTGTGVKIWSQRYGSPSGKNVILIKLTFPSEEAARQSMGNGLHGAEIIERNPIIDEEGKQTGERIITRHAFSSMHFPINRVVLFEGTQEFVIQGSVMDDVLGLEEHLKSKGTI